MSNTNDTTEKRGTIVNAQAEGGLMTLFIRGEDGKVQVIRGDNGPTVRALINVFGTDIVRGHSLQVDRIQGQEILYDTDDLGLLAYVAPVE